jgi:Flp pilus assembly protein TadD
MDTVIALARAAVAKGDWAAALQSWQSLLDARPDLEEAYTGVGLALRRLGRPDEAERVLTHGVALFPDARQLAIEHAWVAYDLRDWPEAVRRFGVVLEQSPDDPAGHVGLGAALREMDRLEEAEAVLFDQLRLERPSPSRLARGAWPVGGHGGIAPRQPGRI